jgi:hypothetical protein
MISFPVVGDRIFIFTAVGDLFSAESLNAVGLLIGEEKAAGTCRFV